MPATWVPWLASKGRCAPAGPGEGSSSPSIQSWPPACLLADRSVSEKSTPVSTTAIAAMGRRASCPRCVKPPSMPTWPSGRQAVLADPLALVEQAPLLAAARLVGGGKRGADAHALVRGRPTARRRSAEARPRPGPLARRAHETTCTSSSAGTACTTLAPASRRAAVRSPAEAEPAKRTTRRSLPASAARAGAAPAAAMKTPTSETTRRRATTTFNGRSDRRLDPWRNETDHSPRP